MSQNLEASVREPSLMNINGKARLDLGPVETFKVSRTGGDQGANYWIEKAPAHRVIKFGPVAQPVEFVNFRAVHTFPLPRPVITPAAPSGGTPDAARIGERRAYFGGFVTTAIYERARLPRGARLAGPAIVEQLDTTTVVPPGVTALVDEAGHLRLRRAP